MFHGSAVHGRRWTMLGRPLAFVGVEMLMWVVFYGAYLVVRGLAISAEPTAMANAHGLIDVERALGILREVAKENRHQLQASGYFERLPWKVTW